MQALCTRNVGISGNISRDNVSEEQTKTELICAGFMCVVAVKKHLRRRRRRRQQEEERRCSQDTADISESCATSQDARRSMQPKVCCTYLAFAHSSS